MASLKDLGVYVKNYVPDASIALITQEVRNAAHEFARSTEAWVVDLAPMREVKDVKKYNLISELSGAEIIKLLVLRKRRDETDEGEGILLNPNIDYTMNSVTEFELCQKPQKSVAKAFIIKVAYANCRSSDVYSDHLLDTYFEGIAYGARQRLMATPGKPYTSVRGAAYNLARFWDEIRRARADVTRGYTNATGKNLTTLGQPTNAFVV